MASGDCLLLRLHVVEDARVSTGTFLDRSRCHGRRHTHMSVGTCPEPADLSRTWPGAVRREACPAVQGIIAH